MIFLEKVITLVLKAVIKAYEKGQEVSRQPTVTEESKKILFDQTSANLKQDG